MLAQHQIESVFLRPANIASRRFARSKDGYDPEEVHQYLEDVADYLSRLEGELEWRKARRSRRSGTIGEQEEAISVVTAAREHAERILAEARKEAEGYIRLARAIAHQLALEAQARRPPVALAVTRASESSTTVEGFQDFEDMEVWVDASVFDLTKVEEERKADEAVASDDAGTASVAASDEASIPDVSSVADAAKPDVSASDNAFEPQDAVTTSEDLSGSGEVSASETSSASDDASRSVGVAAPDEGSMSDKKSLKKAKKRSKKKS